MDYDIIDRMKMAYEYCVNHNDDITNVYNENNCDYCIWINKHQIAIEINGLRAHLEFGNDKLDIHYLADDETEIMIKSFASLDYLVIKTAILEKLV